MKAKHLFSLAMTATLGGVVECAAQYKSFTMEERAAQIRTGHMELYFAGQYWHAESVTAHDVTINLPPLTLGNVKLDFDDTGLWGLGMAYHFNEHFAVNAEFMFGKPDYTMTFQDSRLDGKAFLHTGKFNAEYNFLSGRITPFVAGGLGYFYIDSNIPSGRVDDIYCWWDFWWGQSCSGSIPTYKRTYLATNGAIGIRWDINDAICLRLYGGANFVLLDNAAVDWLTTTQIALSVGWKF